MESRDNTDFIGEEEKVEVLIPSGVRSGDSINVQTVDGRIFSVVIPSNVQPGERLVVIIPQDCEGGSTVNAGTVQVRVPNATSANGKAVGITAATAIVGTLLIGPITGIVVAGVALYATTRNDTVGDYTRSAGGLVCDAYAKGQEISTKYEIPQKLKAAGTATVNKMQAIDTEYNLSHKASVAGAELARQAKELDNKYAITATTSRAIAQGVTMGTRELFKLATSTSSTTSNASNTSSNSNANPSLRL